MATHSAPGRPPHGAYRRDVRNAAHERAPHHPHDVSDELSPDAVRHAGRRRGRAARRRPGRPGQSRQPRLSLRARPRGARDHRQPEALADPADPGAAGGRRLAPGLVGRGARPDRLPHAGRGARGRRPLGGPRPLRQQLRHARRLALAPALRQCLGLPVVEPHDDLLGARRLRARAHGGAGDQYEGGHGRARGSHPALGRESREPAQHGPPSRRGAPPRRPPRGHRRPRDRGRRAGRRGDPDPARARTRRSRWR